MNDLYRLVGGPRDGETIMAELSGVLRYRIPLSVDFVTLNGDYGLTSPRAYGEYEADLAYGQPSRADDGVVLLTWRGWRNE